jgi:hypothetical protein
MPKIYNTNSDIRKEYSENELPINIVLFIKELKNNYDFDNLSFDEYVVYIDKATGEVSNELTLNIEIDAEKYAKDKRLKKSKIDDEMSITREIFDINYLYLRTTITNKSQFAEKFLKDLKKELKNTELGKGIHQIRFNQSSTSSYDFYIDVIKKKDYWSPTGARYVKSWDIEKFIDEYLEQKGYTNLKSRVR